MNKTQLAEESAALLACPFCAGAAAFHAEKDGKLHLHHYPEPGIICPARFDQYCDSFKQGREWWNIRTYPK